MQEQIFHISGLKKAPQMGSNKKDSVTEKAEVWEEAAGKVCPAQSRAPGPHLTEHRPRDMSCLPHVKGVL